MTKTIAVTKIIPLTQDEFGRSLTPVSLASDVSARSKAYAAPDETAASVKTTRCGFFSCPSFSSANKRKRRTHFLLKMCNKVAPG